MKIFFAGLLVFVNLLCGSTVTKEKSNDLKIKIVEISRSGEITVGISNSSEEPIRVWRESNSWGAAHWRVLLIRKGQLGTFFQNPDQGFTKNNPAFDEIAAGSHIERKLNLNGENWRGVDSRRIDFESGDTVIVVYDVPKVFGWPDAPATVEAHNMGVWYGVTAAFIKVK
jgi:hypothetical protein